MNRSLSFSLALTALATLPLFAAAQTTAGKPANDAADAAERVAARASGAFERIDPDLTLPQTEAAPIAGEIAVTDAKLPLLDGDGVNAPASVSDAADAPAARGPAVRMIAREVVQPLPTAAPEPTITPTLAAITNKNPFVIKSILPIEGSIRYGDWFWDESAAPKAGKLVITVDLDARVISAFRDGHEIGTAVALLGTQSHPTPLGSFPILTKEKDNVSEKYNNAPMPHTLRLTWDGIAIHGSPVMNGYASHGCVGVPDEFAAKLFAAAKRGDKVIITRGKMVGVGDKVL